MRRRTFLALSSLSIASLLAHRERVLTTLSVPPLNGTRLNYGRHFPNGDAAVHYIYGPDGTWKQLHDVQYIWNYYLIFMTSNHPFDRYSLLQYANGTNQTTTRDANGHLLLDFNHDGELDVTSGGSAFEEHNGRGIQNQVQGLSFSNFWFDDNWLARYMAQAYNQPEPYGLSQYNDFSRWQILGGDTSHWIPYNTNYVDTLALDGLYYLSSGDLKTALSTWDQLRNLTNYSYDPEQQRYAYPAIQESYHLGAFKILTDKLILNDTVSDDKRNELIQHSISLRAILLTTQERNGSQLYGWISRINDPRTLINTETVAINVLALGAGGLAAYEAGVRPLLMNNKNFVMQPYHALSAIAGTSQPGYMTYGPYQHQPLGMHWVDFYMRASHPVDGMAQLDVYDASQGLIIAQRNVNASDLLLGNEWTRVSLPFITLNLVNKLEFRTWWQGTTAMDIAYIQLR